MPSSKISACPNCGNTKDFTANCHPLLGPGEQEDEKSYYESNIQCLDCDLQTGSSINTICPCSTKEEAIEAAIQLWNDFSKRCAKGAASTQQEDDLRAHITTLEFDLDLREAKANMYRDKLEELYAAVRPLVTFATYYTGHARVKAEHLTVLEEVFSKIKCSG